MAAIVRIGTESEDVVFARCFYRMWRDIGIGEDEFHGDWEDRTLAFVRESRKEREFRVYYAEVEGHVVGSAGCEIFSLYPALFRTLARRQGLVWGVYVEPEHRRQGLAAALTQACVDYLRSVDCIRIKLHASPQGRPVYEGLGFVPSNEMVLAPRT